MQKQLYAPISMDVEDFTGMELVRIKVVAMTRDHKGTQLNPGEDFPSPMWFISITR
jgi:hypothetical protein